MLTRPDGLCLPSPLISNGGSTPYTIDPLFVTSHQSIPLQTQTSIWVDASTDWGLGLLINGRWDAWRVINDWKGDCCNIGWLEAIIIEFLVSVLISLGHHDSSFLIHSDFIVIIKALSEPSPKVDLRTSRPISSSIIPNYH
jgi:hypothetical protein